MVAVKVKCPVCTNKRLMDMITARAAELEIKCPRCGSIINLTLKDNRIKARKV